MYKLLVLRGPDSGVEFPVEGSGLVVGRSSSCSAVLSDSSVSRRHFSIETTPESIRLLDLSSSNGTYVDGRRIRKIEISPGTIISAGSSEFTLIREGDERPSLAQNPVPAATTVLTAIDAACLLKKDDSKAERLDLLFKAAKILQEQQDLHFLGRKLLGLCADAFRATQAVLYLTEGRNRLRQVAAVGLDSAPYPPKKVIVSVLSRNKGMLIDKPAASICVPLPAGNETVGALYLSKNSSPGASSDSQPWNDEDLALLVLIGDVAGPSILNLLTRFRLSRERGRFHRLLRQSCGIVGTEKTTERLLTVIHKLAAAPSSVLIQGESGTGKELVARALHYNGPRAGQSFIAVNCAAIPHDMAESELFGHEKGAFTGAANRRRGKFELADKGTLFLDEIGELSPAVQSKLLRVLETREFERVGGERTVSVDVRLVAASNKNLKTEVREGRFREDLYYRLNVFSITISPLRKRKYDIPVLVQHFLDRISRETGMPTRPFFTKEAMKRLKLHNWPGNVRELKNVVEHCVVLAEGPELGLSDLPHYLACPQASEIRSENLQSLAQLEAFHIRHVLTRCNWNKKKAAGILGIERATLYAKMKKYGIA